MNTSLEGTVLKVRLKSMSGSATPAINLCKVCVDHVEHCL